MRDSRAGADCVATPSLRGDQVVIGGVLSEDGVRRRVNYLVEGIEEGKTRVPHSTAGSSNG